MPRITKLRFKQQRLELSVISRNGTGSSFLFLCSSRSDSKRLWTYCVQHHNFYRLQRGGASIKVKTSSSLRSLVLPRFSSTNHRRASDERTSHRSTPPDTDSKWANHRGASGCTCPESTNNRVSCNTTDTNLWEQTAPPAVSRCVGRASSSGGSTTFAQRAEDSPQSSVPWESSSQSRGMFSPQFPVSSTAPERPHRRSRSLDEEQPIGAQRWRPRSHGNSSSESEWSEQRRRRKHRCGSHGNRTPDSAHRRHKNRT
ncbi:hypothetical protein NQD34_009263 [Periophthalmus magnuspinnatus]|nr:hypothetical protein NQD34_009263 [Periophthalmus magnuspinnatus]